ncbi:MAG: hypothetical protein AABZ12_07930 [Planctomycetota bacterium]
MSFITGKTAGSQDDAGLIVHVGTVSKKIVNLDSFSLTGGGPGFSMPTVSASEREPPVK